MDSLKSLRIALGMTQAAFAAALGIPKRTVENWECGKSSPPDYVVRLIFYWAEKEYEVKLSSD